MKNLFLLGLLLSLNYSAFSKSDIPKQNQISFKENKGQVSDQNYKPRPDVLFSGNDGSLVYHLKNNGISYQLSKAEDWTELDENSIVRHKTGFTKTISKATIYRLDLNWINTNPNITIQKGEATEGYDNYYLPVCPDGVLNVKSYGSVTYKNIYNGIDLQYYSKEGHLKYDYKVKAGADHNQIKIEVNGAQYIRVNENGELEISTPLGLIREEAPLVIQNNKILPASWAVKNNIVSFKIKDLDKTLPFTIDPLVRSWGTYYGGNGSEGIAATKIDTSGKIIICGSTQSFAGIATVGTFSSNFSTGGSDAYVAKFNSTGVRAWGTYYGAVNTTYGWDIDVETSGNIVLVGQTGSPGVTASFTTTGCYQPNYGGGVHDGYIVKFNTNGQRIWGTYFGGSGGDGILGCSIDKSGDMYFTGATTTSVSASIASPGCFQPVYSGADDVFLAKFSSAGARIWSTYYGGTVIETALDCPVDTVGNVYIAGQVQTTSVNIVTTPGCYQANHAGGFWDMYITKFDANGNRVWGTYYGSSNNDSPWGLCTSPSGYLYITGDSNSQTNISSPGAFQTSPGSSAMGTLSAVLLKFDLNGNRVWATYYGGSTYDRGRCCFADKNGDVYMSGAAQSTIGIATPGAYQTVYGGGTPANGDAFVVKFNSAGQRYWGTYCGSTGDESTTIVAANGYVYFGGFSNSPTSTVISTPASHQPNNLGLESGFLIKFQDCSDLIVTSNSSVLCSGSQVTLTATGATSYTWNTGANTPMIVETPTITTTYSVVSTTTVAGCPAPTGVFTQSVIVCTAIFENALDQVLNVYPNPNNGLFKIASSGNEKMSIEIYNSMGELILMHEVESRESEINMSQYAQGVYIAKVSEKNSGKTRTFKIIKQ